MLAFLRYFSYAVVSNSNGVNSNFRWFEDANDYYDGFQTPTE